MPPDLPYCTFPCRVAADASLPQAAKTSAMMRSRPTPIRGVWHVVLRESSYGTLGLAESGAQGLRVGNRCRWGLAGEAPFFFRRRARNLQRIDVRGHVSLNLGILLA